MKKFFFKIFEFLTNSKVHSDKSLIMGKKSGGTRDGNNKGWKNPHQTNPTN
jgi:hypothetical protein